MKIKNFQAFNKLNTIKKIILILFFLIPIVLASDLYYYPNFLIDNRSIDTVLVIGENAGADESAALNIVTSLKLSEYYLNDSLEYDPKILTFLYTAPLKRDSKITNLYDKNIIIIGGPCANKMAARITSLPTTWPECAAGFKQDFAKIKLYNNYGKYQLLVAGYEAKDTLGAANVLANFTSYTLIGKEIEVNTYNLSDIKLKKIE